MYYCTMLNSCLAALLLGVSKMASALSASAAASAGAYPIGTHGVAWGLAEKSQWRETRTIQRFYSEDVLAKLGPLKEQFDVQQYGALSQDKDKYPLFAVKTRNWDSAAKPCVMVTGGVHGYETSGVHGALLFLTAKAAHYSKHFNILVVPCVSPWGYETIQRWNAQAVDPNRSFNPQGQVVEGRSFNPEPATEESSALIAFLESLNVKQWTCHLDLHETTDTDDTEFRPAKAARDGSTDSPSDPIPDGFYLVSDATTPQTEWYTAMIDAVRKVTHIAPSEPDGTLIGEPVSQEGVIQIPSPKTLGLCAGVTNAPYATTTEVYPDSPQATDEQCNLAQLACIQAALDYIIQTDSSCAAAGQEAKPE